MNQTPGAMAANEEGHKGMAAGELANALSDYPASPASRRAALVIVAVSLGMFLALLPFADQRLAAAAWFIPLHQPVLAINDLITASLLFGYLRLTCQTAVLVLACGYLYSAVMAIVHMLSFPGVFSAAGLFGAGGQSTGYLHVLWHLGFPIATVAYALLKESGHKVTGLAAATTLAVGITLGPSSRPRGPGAIPFFFRSGRKRTAC